MFINVQLGQRTDVYFELICIVQAFCQLWIQAVDSLDNKDII